MVIGNPDACVGGYTDFQSRTGDGCIAVKSKEMEYGGDVVVKCEDKHGAEYKCS
jgi:hypothetical protein